MASGPAAMPQKRDAWLEVPRLRLGALVALAGDPATLERAVGGRAAADRLLELHRDWAPRLRLPLSPTRSARRLARAVKDLAESFRRFNGRWQRFLETIDLTDLNRLREGYNKYYVFEKECVVGSPAIARAGFEPLRPATVGDLLGECPFLPVLQN
jgi:hypothetical protein